MHKKILAVAVAAVALTGCNSSDDKVAVPSRMDQLVERVENPNDNRDHVLVVGHRALWTDRDERLFPEQSLKSIQYAIDQNIDAVELDIRVTADEQYVILHDASLNRTTTCEGSVSQKTWDEIKDCKLTIPVGDDGNYEITDETIPTLEQVYELAKDKILINLDNKVGNARYPDMLNMAVDYGVDRQILASVRMANEAGRESGYALIKEWEDSNVKFMPNIYDSDPDFSVAGDYRVLEEILQTVNPVIVQVRNAYRYPDPVTMDGGYFFTEEALALRDQYDTHFWINTLYDSNPGLRSGGRGDEMAFYDGLADEVWGWWHRTGATIFQTDEPIFATEFLEEKGYRQPYK